MGDSINDIHLLFDGDYPSLVGVREHFDPLLHSLHDHPSQFDMIVNTLDKNLEDVSLSSEDMFESLDIILHSPPLDIGLSFFSNVA